MSSFGDETWGSGNFGDPFYEPPIPPDVEYGTVPPPEEDVIKKIRPWKVTHYTHAGIALGEVYPQEPEFALYLGKVGYLNYDIDMDSSMASKVNTEPYATDYGLYYGEHKLAGGMHTDIAIEDAESHTMKVSCKDWYHWFEKQMWPFNPANPTAYLYTAFNRDMFTIVEEWLTMIQSFPYTIPFTFANGLSGATTNAKIEIGDNEDMLSKITTLSQQQPGFDFEITPDREFKMYYPRKTRINDLILEQGANVYQFSYTNHGPNATHTLATAQLPSYKTGYNLESAEISKYRRLMATADLGTLPDETTLNRLAQGEAGRNNAPHLEFTMKIIPEFVEDIFDAIQLGDTITVIADLGWDYINSSFRLVSIVGGPNNEGDQEYELGFDDGTISL